MMGIESVLGLCPIDQRSIPREELRSERKGLLAFGAINDGAVQICAAGRLSLGALGAMLNKRPLGPE